MVLFADDKGSSDTVNIMRSIGQNILLPCDIHHLDIISEVIWRKEGQELLPDSMVSRTGIAA